LNNETDANRALVAARNAPPYYDQDTRPSRPALASQVALDALELTQPLTVYQQGVRQAEAVDLHEAECYGRPR